MADFNADISLSIDVWTDVTGNFSADDVLTAQAKYGGVIIWLGPTAPAATSADGMILDVPVDESASVPRTFTLATKIYAKALTVQSKLHLSS